MGQNLSDDRSWNKYGHSQQLSSAEIAEQLICNGFCPIPVKAKTKKPAFNDWPTRAFQPSDFKNSCSVGLKTGNGLIGLDIDHYDHIVVQQIRNEAERYFGVGLARIGQPPKILLLYRCDFITKKQTLKLAPSGKAPEGKSEALEVLAKGQQAVVSGIHPETNAPYFWETVEPWDIAAGQLGRLPQIRENEWTAFLAHVQETFGQTLKTTSKHDIKQSLNLNSSGDEHRAGNFHSNHEASLEEVEKILSYIDPSCGYDTWLAVTMGVKFLGEQFYGTWLSWSSKGTNHESNVDPRKWYEVSTVGGITFATVCQLAGEAGADLSEIARKHKGKSGTEKTISKGDVEGIVNTTKQESEPLLQDDPVDLWDNFDPPKLPEGLLPPLIEQFALLNGKQMGADPAGLAVAALVTCAAAIPDQVQIKVKRHDDWKESPRLWAALVGSPSAKKSPIISRATEPLCRLDFKMMCKWERRMQEYNALSAEEKKGRQRPPQTRLRIEDATIEATQQVLEGSPWGVLLLQDELSGFFGAMDKYNAGKGAQADRAFWLRSFNGGQYAINRVTRGATVIDNVSVSMLGGIQPEPLIKISSDAADDGLLQRLFPIMLSTTPVGRDEPMLPINDSYAELISSLRKTSLPGILEKRPLEFDDGAQAIWRSLEAKHLELQSLETINRKLASHIGKYDGLFARLCIIWHCVEHSECATADDSDRKLPVVVTERTAQRVADFLHQFLLSHALAFYSGVLGLSDDHDRLEAIAGYILTHKLTRVTNRDIQRGDRTMRGLKEHETRPLLEQLSALGWLNRVDALRPSSPPHWQVNPAVHKKFADRAVWEAKRREATRKMMRKLSKK